MSRQPFGQDPAAELPGVLPDTCGRVGEIEHVVSGFTVSADEATGRVLLRVAGELDMATAPLLRDALAQHHDRDVDVDGSALTFVDSTGLSVLLAAKRRWDAEERSLRLVDPSRPLRRLLELAGVERAFEIEES